MTQFLIRIFRFFLRLRGYESIPLESERILAFKQASFSSADAERITKRHFLHEQINDLARLYDINCVLDVGANKGDYAVLLREGGYRGHIFSFEPIPALVEKLEAMARDDEKWTILPFALGSKEHTTTLHLTSGADYMSSLQRPNEYFHERFSYASKKIEEIDVAVKRLDAVYPELIASLGDVRLLLKLDTQGHDLEVFEGFGAHREDILVLQSELACIPIYEDAPGYREALDVYDRAGLALATAAPISFDEKTGRTIELDCLFVRLS